ncbi:MAG: sugar phosphate isomerase/epimerase [Spirochaetaceae bacterium]|nr:MAG: sugar phosphate isomerase/epimerase [Spirochaetaceae bacterium]
MRVGCHAVLFREQIVDDGESIIAAADRIGYDGIEIGSRFYGVANRQGLLDRFADRRIELSGMHVGTGWDAWIAGPAGEQAKVVEVARFLAGFPNRNVIMSCGAPKGDVDAAMAARAINAAAAACRRAGARLHYHNHSWEFEHDAVLFRALRDNAPDLHFALDLGWVEKIGADQYALLDELQGRVSYVHVRDLGTDDFVDLGDGNTDLDRLAKTLSRVLGADGWLVVEYEYGDKEMERYRRAYDYLSKLGVASAPEIPERSRP